MQLDSIIQVTRIFTHHILSMKLLARGTGTFQQNVLHWGHGIMQVYYSHKSLF